MNHATFQSTRWTLVQRVGPLSEAGARAMTELCEIYYKPVHQFILYRIRDDQRAEDLTHSFFAQMLEKNSLGTPDPERGKFRTYLLGAVKYFLSAQHAQETAKKRGGDLEKVKLDDSIFDEDDHRSFDRDWALALIARAHNYLHQEMVSAGKERQFEVLRLWLDGGSEGDSSEAAEKLGLSANAFKVAVHRLRSKFRQAVYDEIAATTLFPEEIDEEFSHLIGVLAEQ